MTDDPVANDKLALLAHDLRTPLSAMRLTAELIGREPLSPTQRDRLELLISSMEALGDLTGELVQTQEQAGEGKRALHDIVSDTGKLFRAAAEAKGLTLLIKPLPNGLVIKQGQAATLRRVMTILLDNAVKYTDTGSITLAASLLPADPGLPQVIRISIADTGPGIAPAERDHIFKLYARGTTGMARSRGSGLGLWGATRLISDLGGKLRLVSPRAGGCRFEIDLPVDYGVSGGREEETDNKLPGEAHVLIVDDNDTNRRLLSALLESFSISCDQAASGAEALKMMPDTRYDAVLLDLHMPEMDGLETAQKIKALENQTDVPLIAVTAALESVGDKRLHQAGFIEVLAKPLSPSHLFQAMEHARQRRAATTATSP